MKWKLEVLFKKKHNPQKWQCYNSGILLWHLFLPEAFCYNCKIEDELHLHGKQKRTEHVPFQNVGHVQNVQNVLPRYVVFATWFCQTSIMQDNIVQDKWDTQSGAPVSFPFLNKIFPGKAATNFCKYIGRKLWSTNFLLVWFIVKMLFTSKHCSRPSMKSLHGGAPLAKCGQKGPTKCSTVVRD